jgi:hypothetical protein
VPCYAFFTPPGTSFDEGVWEQGVTAIRVDRVRGSFVPACWLDAEEVRPVWVQLEELELRQHVPGLLRWQAARREWLAGQGDA